MKIIFIVTSLLLFTERLCSQSHSTKYFNTIPVFNSEIIQRDTVLKSSCIINKNLTIKSHCTFQNAEFIFAENVELILDSGATLEIIGSHLYSQGSKMWKGIRLSNGAKLIAKASKKNSVLIEDTENAIEINVGALVQLNKTILNKNYIDIKLIVNPLEANPLTLSDCIFTCRNFTFNPISWPGVSTSSTGLRFASSPTTGLAPPYAMQSASITNLKSPYNSQRSHIAIQLNQIGTTQGNGPLIFNSLDLSPASSGDFNLFDAHNYFIKSTNSNLKISNTVFQNTQTFTVSSTPSITVGAAVDFSCSFATYYQAGSNHHAFELDMSAGSTYTANRFYDCHRAIDINNAWSFKLENAQFRSTHAASVATNTAVLSTGSTGVFARTNQVEDYIIHNNDFSNISDGVLISLQAGGSVKPFLPFSGTYTWAGQAQVCFVNTISIQGNTFSPEPILTFTSPTTSCYVRNAVSVKSALYSNVSTFCCGGVHIENNVMHRVFNGISLSTVNELTLTCRSTGVKKIISHNKITLAEDNIWNFLQKGIEYVNSTSNPAGHGLRLQTVEENILTVFTGTPAMSNTNISLYYGYNNGGTGTLYPTPHILCNDLSNANTGFMFNGLNNPASVKGNTLTDLEKGLCLTGYSVTTPSFAIVQGIIGKQGDATHPSDNVWAVGTSSWSGSNYGTYVDNNSDAANSKLYVQNSGNYVPPNNGGNAVPGKKYSGGSNITIMSGTFTAYTCGSTVYPLSVVALPNATISSNTEGNYIACTLAYRYLFLNDSMRNADPRLQEFCDSLNGSSIDKFMQVEQKLMQGALEDAGDILSGISTGTFNTIEQNYFNFYGLYKKYFDTTATFTSDDLGELTELCGLCLGAQGGAVSQARALYQLITGSVYNGPDGCFGGGGQRPGKAPPDNEKIISAEITWDVDLFPNPNTGSFALISKSEKEILEVIIHDLGGKEVYRKQVQTSKYYYVLNVELGYGLYFVTVKNQNHEIVTKKMGVAK